MTIRTIFFDIGGVLLTNGWDFDSRKKAISHFSLDEKDFGRRHEMLRHALDTGRVSLDQYMTKSVFYTERSFNKGDFLKFMKEQSQSFADMIQIAKEVRATKKYPIFALNNESRELHEFRVEQFGLHSLFDGFLSSCYVGYAKPEEEIYLRALGITNSKAEESVLIDDRAINIESAAALGFKTILHSEAKKTKEALVQLGIL